jgi:hypothetical protein
MKAFKPYAEWLFYASVVGVVLAGYGALTGSDLWLAPTQWLEVTIVTVLYAIYLKHE